MPISPLGALKLGARIAAPFIRLGVRLGRSLLETTQSILRSGLDAVESELARVYRAEQRLRAETTALGALKGREKIDPIGIPEAITWQRRTYAWKHLIEYIDPATGNIESQYITVSTNDVLTPDESAALAEEAFLKNYGVGRERITKSETIGVTKAAPGRTL